MVGERVQQKWLCQFWVRPLTALLPDAVWWEEARPQKKRTRTGVVAATELPTKASFQTSHVSNHHGYSICLLQNPSRHDNWEIPREKTHPAEISYTSELWDINSKIVISALKQNFYFMARQKKLKQKFSLPFGLPSPHILHCVSFPKSRNTCSTIRSNIPLASTRQFFKDAIPSSSRGVTWWPGLCKLSIIRHLMYSSLSQKSYITVPWLLKGGRVLRAFWGAHPEL